MTLRWACPDSCLKHPKNTYKTFKLKCYVHCLHDPALQKVFKVRQNRINRLKASISPSEPCVVAGCIFWGLLAFAIRNSAYSEAEPICLAQSQHILKSLSMHLPLPLFRSHTLPAVLQVPFLVLLFLSLG